ncbi:MAG TPA: protein phosphatase CheZ [Steroidobacteraceae bacterium]|jgi:chemotaxis protein CheZ
MTSSIELLEQEYGATIAALAGALAAGDEQTFFEALDSLVQRRERSLFGELRKLTTDLQSALERFSIDSRLVDLAEKEVPDARHRLDHVLKLTDEAAHRTMDLVEQSCPLADRTAKQADEIVAMWRLFRSRTIAVADFANMVKRMDAFLPEASADMNKVRGNLAEVLLAQGYQDLSGQIIRGVMTLVGELESALTELVRLSRTSPHSRQPAISDATRRGFGPVVPGIDRGPAVSGQQDVDALLSGLGM